jgi:ABC-type glycerol-3-phosphate transport system permease component
MIGRAPRWVVFTVGAIAFIWIIPIIGVIVTSVRPTEDTILGALTT